MADIEVLLRRQNQAGAVVDWPISDDGEEFVKTKARALKIDYAARTDKQPVYLGAALPGSASADPEWTVKRFTYESAVDNARLTAIDIQEGISWTDRTLGWPA